MRACAVAVLTAATLTCTAGPALAVPDVSAKDRAAITKVLNTVERSTDPAKACAGFTSSLIKTMFGSKAQCRAVMTHDAAGYPTSITVSAISVSGHHARAKVRENGGTSPGISGTWHLTGSNGTWKVSGIDADYFRSLLAQEFGSTYKAAEPEDPFAIKPYRSCGLAGLLHRSDKSLLTVIDQLQSNRNSTFGTVFNACTSKAPDGEAPWHRFFEDSLRTQNKAAGVPDDVTECIVTKLHTAISETALINTLMDGRRSPAGEKFNKQIDTIIHACTKGGSAGQIRRPQGIIRPPIH